MKKLIVLLALATSFSAMAGDYQCTASEPAFSLSIEGDVMTYKNYGLDDYATAEIVVSRIEATNTANDYAFVVKTGTAAVSILTTSCTDEGNKRYPKQFLFSKGDTVVYGCCRPIK